MTYKGLTCYFLSGTGNSFRAAKWLAEDAAGKGIAAEVVPISDARPREDLERGARQLVGIYHPAHGLMPPWSMIKFLLKMPLGHGAHAIVVSTRGAIPIRLRADPGRIRLCPVLSATGSLAQRLQLARRYGHRHAVEHEQPALGNE